MPFVGAHVEHYTLHHHHALQLLRVPIPLNMALYCSISRGSYTIIVPVDWEQVF